MTDTQPPPLPQVGALDWGPDLNAVVTWLYEQQLLYAATIDDNKTTIADLTALVTSYEDRIAALEAAPQYAYNSYSWMYSNQSPPPTGNQVRFDNPDLSLATMAIFRLQDSDSADRTPVFQRLTVGSQIRINDWDDAAKIHRFHVAGPVDIAASDATVPITWIGGSGVIPNAKVNIAFLVALSL